MANFGLEGHAWSMKKGQKVKKKYQKSSSIHCNFNAVYELLFEQAVYELQPAKVTYATWNKKKCPQ